MNCNSRLYKITCQHWHTNAKVNWALPLRTYNTADQHVFCVQKEFNGELTTRGKGKNSKRKTMENLGSCFVSSQSLKTNWIIILVFSFWLFEQSIENTTVFPAFQVQVIRNERIFNFDCSAMHRLRCCWPLQLLSVLTKGYRTFHLETPRQHGGLFSP
jgi:hypothetical protein